MCRIDGCGKPPFEKSSLCVLHMEKGREEVELFVKRRSKRPISCAKLMKLINKMSLNDEPVKLNSLRRGA